MLRETRIWVGDGIRPLRQDEMVGRPVNIDGRKGVVVANSALTITVEYEKPPSWFRRLLSCLGW